MSTRWYCDLCDSEVRSPEAQPKFATLVTFKSASREGLGAVDFQITRCIEKKGWNSGHLCDECLAKAFEYAADSLRDIRDQRAGA